MRTTVTIDDRLLELARQRATREGATLGSVVEEALRRLLAAPEPERTVQLPLLRGGHGFQPGFDPLSNVELAERMDRYDREVGAEPR